MILAAILAPFRRVIGWAVAAALAGAAIWAMAKRDTRRETALEAAERYAKTRKAIDDADATLDHDPAVLREWLRERGQQ